MRGDSRCEFVMTKMAALSGLSDAWPETDTQGLMEPLDVVDHDHPKELLISLQTSDYEQPIAVCTCALRRTSAPFVFATEKEGFGNRIHNSSQEEACSLSTVLRHLEHRSPFVFALSPAKC